MNEAQAKRLQALIAKTARVAPAEREAYLNTQTEDAEVTRAVITLLRRGELDAGFMATGGGITTPLTSLSEGDEVGPWRVESSLGVGGFGEVYKVVRSDGHFEMAAALKVISTYAPDALERFTIERQLLAQLEHPSIARLIDGGVTKDERPWLVLEHVEGAPITEAADGLSKRDKIALILRLCEAVQYAHERRVLHRDIKPANVLVTETGALKLIDFGVAGLFEEADAVSDPAPMTQAYAAPEQVAGGQTSTRTDVYALGVLLGEVLTGERLSDGALAKGLSKDERAIITKATATEAADRYTSVSEFAEDLRYLISNQPVSARQSGRLYRFGKFLKRNPAKMALAGALGFSLIGGLAVSTLALNEARISQQNMRAALIRYDQSSRFGAFANQTFAEVVTEALGQNGISDEAFLNVLDAKRDEAVTYLEEDPEWARNTLYALSRLHAYRRDRERMLASVSPFYEAEKDEWGSASHLSLMRYANALGDEGMLEEATSAFDRAEALIRQSPQAFAFDLANLQANRARYVSDPAQLLSAANDIAEQAERIVAQKPLFYIDDARKQAFYNNDLSDAVHLMRQAGYLAKKAEDLDLAAFYFARAYEINQSEDLPQKAIPDERILFPWAETEYARGNYDKALEISEKNLPLAETLYGASAAYDARLDLHAEILFAMGKIEEAGAIKDQIGAPN